MSFNLNNEGRPVCKIIGGKYDNKIVCYKDDDEYDLESKEGKYNNFLGLTLTDGKFTPYPNTTKERDVCSFFGPSGSGKSYLAKAYIKEYHKIKPKNPMYLLSTVDEDASLSDVKLNKILLDQSLVSDPIEMEDFGDNCLIMLDDIDTVSNKDIKAKIDGLKDQILETGRHKKITCLVTSHLATKGRETKTLLNESNLIVIYPSSGSNYDTLLINYLGLNTKQIQRLKQFKSRWVAFIRSYPIIVFTERNVLFLSEL
jgi:predicted AAA+ superfamily ATPase